MFIFEELLEIDAEADMREVWRRLAEHHEYPNLHLLALAGRRASPVGIVVHGREWLRLSPESAMQGCKQ